MTFEHTVVFQSLDPRPRDFSEDTYRTLTAVDSAVMVIDAAKVSNQEREALRGLPLRDIRSYLINKMDRESRDRSTSSMRSRRRWRSTLPDTWPIGREAISSAQSTRKQRRPPSTAMQVRRQLHQMALAEIVALSPKLIPQHSLESSIWCATPASG